MSDLDQIIEYFVFGLIFNDDNKYDQAKFRQDIKQWALDIVGEDVPCACNLYDCKYHTEEVANNELRAELRAKIRGEDE